MSQANETNQDNADTPACLHCERYKQLVGKLTAELTAKNLLIQRAALEQLHAEQNTGSTQRALKSLQFTQTAQLICLVALLFVAYQFSRIY